ncbi:MAG TPA: choice-of-anchor B family protein [Gammaproteobacteria bacterium]
MKTAIFLAAILSSGAWSTARAAACENGESAGFACSHVEFAGHLSPEELGGAGEVLNDIWGWVDPASTSNNEYAIVGMEDGTAFVRIRDDGTLEFLGRLAASDGDSSIRKSGEPDRARKHCHDELCGAEDSAWRDIKVHDHYAFIVSEATGHGVQVFDLAALRGVDGDAPVQFAAVASAYYAHYPGVGHAHNIFINEATERAYVVGHDNAALGIAGGLHILDISNPMNPEKIGEVNGDGYTHDVQCVVYAGPDPDIAPNREICFASNEDTLTVWDVTSANSPLLLSRTAYSGAAYTHQGWLSDDQRYFFLNDEADEKKHGNRTHLRVFDVSDLAAPELAANYLAPTLAIDHNNYVHGRWLLQSNYAAGLRILDVQDPLHPVEAAYFDPQPTDTAGFYGTWSNYLFPSGLVAFSDINDGFYVVRPTLSTITAPDLSLALTLSDASVTGGDSAGGEFVVSNDGADASDLLMTLHLPAGETFQEIVSPEGWACSGANERVIQCRKGQLAAGSDEEFAFHVLTEAAGSMDVIAMVYGNEADASPADNLDFATLSVKPLEPPANDGGGGGALAWLLPGLLFAARRRMRPE